MSIRLNGPLIKAVAHRKYGKAKLVEQILFAWDSRFGDAPSPATVRRWMGGSLPQTADALWRFCSILDVDPIAIFDSASLNTKESEHFLSAFQRDSWSRFKPFSYMRDFLGRQADWPSGYYQKIYFPERPWHIEEFNHMSNIRKNYYQVVKLQSDELTYPDAPMAFHVAFMQQGRFSNRWLQYGVIVVCNKHYVLININGNMTSTRVKGNNNFIYFETFFGPEPALFRIASLHYFSVILEPNLLDGMTFLRFDG